jgi:hypothetical protein
MVVDGKRRYTEIELNNMLHLEVAKNAHLLERVDIAENRQRHLEIELAQARVSITTWRGKYKRMQAWITRYVPENVKEHLVELRTTEECKA